MWVRALDARASNITLNMPPRRPEQFLVPSGGSKIAILCANKEGGRHGGRSRYPDARRRIPIVARDRRANP
jgi:hypothetical protein